MLEAVSRVQNGKFCYIMKVDLANHTMCNVAVTIS